jgi:hypothetical protein
MCVCVFVCVHPHMSASALRNVCCQPITHTGEVGGVNDREPPIEHLLCSGPWGKTEMNEMQPPMTTQRVSPDRT